jgi:CRISPR/Cas system-associated exonuclease Cas4 (RecB family)
MRALANSLRGAALAFAAALLTQPLLAAQDVRGFSYCAPPSRPACVETSISALAMAACDEDVQLYTRLVFGYRECLEREMERAVREANDAIESWRCRRDKTKCRH